MHSQAKKTMNSGSGGQEVDENKMLLIAKAKRELADLTDFETSVKCISTLSPSELTEARMSISIKE